MKKYKELLIKRKEEVKKTLEGLNESASPVDLNDPIGRLSRMDAISQQQMFLKAKENAKLSLEQIEQALKRIEDDEYGHCLKCEEEIGEKRLQAVPEAPFCINCQPKTN